MLYRSHAPVYLSPMLGPHRFRDGVTSIELLVLAVILTIAFGLLLQLIGA